MSMSGRVNSPVRVMIVEDSASARMMLRRMIETAPDLMVVDTASDPFEAVDKMRANAPDVITLDLEMPRMDGLTFLRRIMAQNPLPVVICSNHTPAGSKASMEALEIGAVEVLSKSTIGTTSGAEGTMQVCDAIRAAAQARMRGARARPSAAQTAAREAAVARAGARASAVAETRAPARPATPAPGARTSSPLVREQVKTADVILPARAPNARLHPRTDPIIGIGSSTGGTEALSKVLTTLPADCPPIAIVQHMPEKFTAAFAARLNSICRITVKEAEDGDRLERGVALIAPGHRHIVVERLGNRYVVQTVDGPAVRRHRPSVDVLFRSLAVSAGPNAFGAILTGMGDDGAACMKEMHDAGSTTVAQDEATSVVYGMPKAAVEQGGAQKSVPLDEVARHLLEFDARHRKT